MKKLQSDLYKLEQWQKTWQMKFNPTKCFIIENANQIKFKVLVAFKVISWIWQFHLNFLSKVTPKCTKCYKTYMFFEVVVLRWKQAHLTTMYKITNDIIHIDKSKYLLPPTETRTRRSHNFKYYLEQTNNDVFKFSYIPGLSESGTLYL